MPGEVSNVEDYYAISDVYVQSSHREALPMSILEAMAAGLPIISTDVGGIRDVVKGNGILVEEANDDALYYAMKKIYDSSEKVISEIQKESFLLSESYSSKKMAVSYMNLYIQALAERQWLTLK